MRPEIKTFVLLIPGLSSYLVFRWLYPARKSKINGSNPSNLKVVTVDIKIMRRRLAIFYTNIFTL